jgi:putative ABC transport system substrate-binding protein
MAVKGLASLTSLALALISSPVEAQEPKVPRIGYIMDRGPTLFDEAFLVGLREHGYVEGKNVNIEYRWTRGNSEQLPELAADLLARNVDVLVTAGTVAVKAVKAATTSVPIVMAASQNPVADGLVASLARPGGNVTGRSVYATELTPKRIQLLMQAVPGVTRIAALWNARNDTGASQFQEAEAAGRALGIVVDSLDARIPDDLGAVMSRAARSGAGAILVLSDTATITHRSEIAAAAQKHRLPTMFANKAYLAGGGLMSYGPDLADTYRRAAAHVVKVFRGAKPDELPVEEPARFELAINLNSAQALGLEVPPALLARADEVIE